MNPERQRLRWGQPSGFAAKHQGARNAYLGAEWRLLVDRSEGGRWNWLLEHNVRGEWTRVSGGDEDTRDDAKQAAEEAAARKVRRRRRKVVYV